MPDLCITGTGAVTAVGVTAAQTAAAVRAGISRFSDHPFHYPLVDPEFPAEPEPMACCSVPFLKALDAAPDRVLNMILAALEEPIVEAGLSRRDLEHVGFFLAAPPEREGTPDWGIERHLYSELQRRSALPQFRVTALARQGSTGFFRLIAAAREALESGDCRVALVGGVDSQLDEATVKYLDARFRVKSTRNADGFVPGEAAAVLVLERRESALARGASVLATISDAAWTNEQNPISGPAQSTGQGLANAIRAVLGAASLEPEWVVCDLNGESYRAYEWGLVRTRLASYLEGLRELWHPADCFGDIRAASPAVHAVLAAQAFRRKYAPARDCLIFASEDAGERAACIVSEGTA